MNNDSNYKNVIWYDNGENWGLNTETTYVIYGVKANFCVFTDSLQVIFKVVNEYCGKNICKYILQEYKINSREYNCLIGNMYSGGQNGIIEVDVNDIDVFSFYGKLKYKNEKYEIDFTSIELISTPVSKLHTELYGD